MKVSTYHYLGSFPLGLSRVPINTDGFSFRLQSSTRTGFRDQSPLPLPATGVRLRQFPKILSGSRSVLSTILLLVMI